MAHTANSNDMPGIFTPSPSHAHTNLQTGYFGQLSRFPFATETPGRQVIDLDGHETRKRFRNDPTSHGFTGNTWGDYSSGYSRFTDARSPPPLADDRYQLAGGDMDGPARFGWQDGDYDDYYRLQHQRGQWSIPPTPAAGTRQFATDGMDATPNGTRSWSILGLVGGVAGKLFQFCTVPFRGFQAGGGQKYAVDGHGEIAAKLGLQDDAFLEAVPGPVRCTTPGDFPEDDYGVKSIDSIDHERNERPRMTKRLRTADNWVVVDNDGEMESRPVTPRLSERRVPSYTRSPSQIPRPISRITTPSAKRPSLIPVSRRSAPDRKSIHSGSKSSPHNRQRSHNRLNYGSPAAYEEKPKKPSSPLPKESQRLINKVRREEMEEDARMRRMSSQMSAMLREAKEALGSKFEVEDYYDDNDDNDDDFGEDAMMQQPAFYPRFS